MEKKFISLVSGLALGAVLAATGCSSSEDHPKPEKTGHTSEAYRYCMYWDDDTNTCSLECETNNCQVTDVQGCNCRDATGQVGNTRVTTCRDTCTYQITNQYSDCVPSCAPNGGGGTQPPLCVPLGGFCVPGNAQWACCSGLSCNVDWYGGGDGKRRVLVARGRGLAQRFLECRKGGACALDQAEVAFSNAAPRAA
jgi:hypothetical protein